MREYLPEVEQSQKLEKLYPEGRRFASQVRRVKTSGDARGRKLKIVCVPCNGGWMSSLQSLVKPVLGPLLLSNKKALSLRKQGILAAWATMFTMVYETVNPEFTASTVNHREAKQVSSSLSLICISVLRVDACESATPSGVTI